MPHLYKSIYLILLSVVFNLAALNKSFGETHSCTMIDNEVDQRICIAGKLNQLHTLFSNMRSSALERTSQLATEADHIVVDHEKLNGSNRKNEYEFEITTTSSNSLLIISAGLHTKIPQRYWGTQGSDAIDARAHVKISLDGNSCGADTDNMYEYSKSAVSMRANAACTKSVTAGTHKIAIQFLEGWSGALNNYLAGNIYEWEYSFNSPRRKKVGPTPWDEPINRFTNYTVIPVY